MELRQLQTFIQIAQMQSFSRTAEMLGYSQSAVTVQIRQLENELGKRLFDRTGKKVVLTPQGEEFLEHANRILYDVHQAIKPTRRAAITVPSLIPASLSVAIFP